MTYQTHKHSKLNSDAHFDLFVDQIGVPEAAKSALRALSPILQSRLLAAYRHHYQLNLRQPRPGGRWIAEVVAATGGVVTSAIGDTVAAAVDGALTEAIPSD